MSAVHIIPEGGLLEHNTKDGLSCWCLPASEDVGVDDAGAPATLFHHNETNGGLGLLPRPESDSLDANEDDE